MDTSGILLGLLSLSRTAEEADHNSNTEETLGGVISKAVLRRLLSALNFRDPNTVRHSRNVAMLSIGMAQYLGWEGQHLKMLEVAALLHDIGKIGVPDNILFKPGNLNPDENELMALHHNIGVDVLQACRAHKEVLEVVSQSNTYFNGADGGYQTIGSEMHQGARILAVADAYDALSTDQVYRPAKPHSEIMKILDDSSGTQFDGNVVAALARWSQSHGLPSPGSSTDTASGISLMTQEAIEASSLCHIFSYLYVLESLYDGFYVVDSDLRFNVWNRGTERLLGYKTQDMLDQIWTSRLIPYADERRNALPDNECPMNIVLEQGAPLTRDVQIQRKDGEWVEVELQSLPLLDINGDLQGVAEIFRDKARTSKKPGEYRELKLAASRDALTSVANRGELETQLGVALNEFNEYPDGEPFSVIFSDVDYFKSINDNYGHGVGDHVLIGIAKLLQHETYSGELVARYGGEEFVVLCPATDLRSAIERAERLRHSIGRATLEGMGNKKVTSSFGVAQVEQGDSIESLLRRADKALYFAKETGRNRTCSLTSNELREHDGLPDPHAGESADPFLFTKKFTAFTGADMLVHKLSGFVHDHKAKLVEVTQQHVIIKTGRSGLFGSWGKRDDQRPVEMEVGFEDMQEASRRQGRTVAMQVSITVRVRPIGRVKQADVFQDRARRAINALRSYFGVNSGMTH